jgi:hypothetical protein
MVLVFMETVSNVCYYASPSMWEVMKDGIFLLLIQSRMLSVMIKEFFVSYRVNWRRVHDIGESEGLFCRDKSSIVEALDVSQPCWLGPLHDRRSTSRVSPYFSHSWKTRKMPNGQRMYITTSSIECMRSAIVLACCQHLLYRCILWKQIRGQPFLSSEPLSSELSTSEPFSSNRNGQLRIIVQ